MENHFEGRDFLADFLNLKGCAFQGCEFLRKLRKIRVFAGGEGVNQQNQKKERKKCQTGDYYISQRKIHEKILA